MALSIVSAAACGMSSDAVTTATPPPALVAPAPPAAAIPVAPAAPASAVVAATVTVTVTATRLPTATAVAATLTPIFAPTTMTQRTSDFAVRPLAELSPDAAAFLSTCQGPRGAAVVVPSRRVIYADDGDELTPMASVAKVAIMVTVMDRAIREQRSLSDWELSMLRPMITVSDNDSATALWEHIGGGAAVEETLRGMGLVNTVPNPMEAWGASRSTPREVALLLAKIALGEVLDDGSRQLALDLMGQVDPSQTWGISAGVPTTQTLHADVAIKDGWLPTQGGWWVNSAGLVMPRSAQPMYALAIMTRQQPTMDYGIETIEGVASRVHLALHPPVTPTTTIQP